MNTSQLQGKGEGKCQVQFFTPKSRATKQNQTY